eukprot:scaffold4062_cov131-Isochrysis_galbana.AAC.1
MELSLKRSSMINNSTPKWLAMTSIANPSAHTQRCAPTCLPRSSTHRRSCSSVSIPRINPNPAAGPRQQAHSGPVGMRTVAQAAQESWAARLWTLGTDSVPPAIQTRHQQPDHTRLMWSWEDRTFSLLRIQKRVELERLLGHLRSDKLALCAHSIVRLPAAYLGES